MSPKDAETTRTAPPDPASAPRPRIKKLEVMVAEVIRETPDSATLVLFTGNDRLDYKPGHFLTIDPHQFPALDRFIQYFEEVKGKREPARAYSLSSAPHEQHLAVTVKEEYYTPGVTRFPPMLSPLLVWRTPPGTRMTVTGFGGPYVLPEDLAERTDHVVHICAGSGMVPNLSLIKHALAEDLKVRHTLVYGSRSRSDIIFRKQLDALESEHPDRLRVVHALSRDPHAERFGSGYRHGRVDLPLLEREIDDPSAIEVFTCGPAIGKWERLAAKESGEPPRPRFMESVLSALDELGIPKERIHRESYG